MTTHAALDHTTITHPIDIRSRGAMVMPLLGAANHDPAVFERPEVFDIARAAGPSRCGFNRPALDVAHALPNPPSRWRAARAALTAVVAPAPGR